jgi:segregation and condensation protein B
MTRETGLRMALPLPGQSELDEAMALGRAVRAIEAAIFAASEPLDDERLAGLLPAGVSLVEVTDILAAHYDGRGVNLVRAGGRWTFRTAPDLAHLLAREQEEPRRLSRAALETLAIIAYHQPVTRAEIEEIRGVATARGTLDLLLETGWVRMRGRRRTPGRPITLGTTGEFLSHFGLNQIGDLPGLDELQKASMFEGRLPMGFTVPLPSDDPTLGNDEDPLEQDFLDELVDRRANEAEDDLSADDSAMPAGEDAPEDEEPLDPLTDERKLP